MVFPKLAEAAEDFPPNLEIVDRVGGVGVSGAFDDPAYYIAPSAVEGSDFAPEERK